MGFGVAVSVFKKQRFLMTKEFPTHVRRFQRCPSIANGFLQISNGCQTISKGLPGFSCDFGGFPIHFQRFQISSNHDQNDIQCNRPRVSSSSARFQHNPERRMALLVQIAVSCAFSGSGLGFGLGRSPPVEVQPEPNGTGKHLLRTGLLHLLTNGFIAFTAFIDKLANGFLAFTVALTRDSSSNYMCCTSLQYLTGPKWMAL